MLAIAIVFLFPTLFALSAHLMRQFLAGSILFYVIIEYVCYSKIKILPFLLAVFIHTTSAFLGVIFFPFFKKEVNIKNIAFISLFTIAFSIGIFRIAGQFEWLFDETPFLGYALDRLANRENAWETENLGALVFLLYFFVVIVFYAVSKKFRQMKTLFWGRVFYLIYVLLVFVLVNYNDTEIALRFSFYLYFFVPAAFYFFPSIIFLNNKEYIRVCVTSIISVFFCWFIYKLNYGTWTYNNIISLTNFSWIMNI
jgi:hypothetical protein